LRFHFVQNFQKAVLFYVKTRCCTQRCLGFLV
jgi:hypothetical protein